MGLVVCFSLECWGGPCAACLAWRPGLCISVGHAEPAWGANIEAIGSFVGVPLFREEARDVRGYDKHPRARRGVYTRSRARRILSFLQRCYSTAAINATYRLTSAKP